MRLVAYVAYVLTHIRLRRQMKNENQTRLKLFSLEFNF